MSQSSLLEGTLSVEEVLLKVTEGPHQGEVLSLDQEVVLVGRGSWCDLVLSQDKKVSKEHCELQLDEGGIRVSDLGSRNGIAIDHVPVLNAYIPPGARLHIGHSVLQFEGLQRRKDITVEYHDGTGALLGQSPHMRRIFRLMSRLASQPIPLLLTGETGTGKTVIARAIHDQSDRKDGPFVAVNCGALPAQLIESLFFGHEKGAFTGADKRRKGYFEQAHGGTLFLDEIGELPLELQPKLLDVLESRQLQPLGSESRSEVDFRLISASHRDLMAEADAGHFRSDLYYRIAVVAIEVPPLRERPEDIPLLAQHLLAQIDPQQACTLSHEAMTALQRYIWPGNVRQLHNILQRLTAFAAPLDPSEDTASSGHVIDLDTIAVSCPELSHQISQSAAQTPQRATPQATTASSTTPRGYQVHGSLKALLEATEKQAIADALHASDGDTAEAADALGISRVWLYNRIKKHGLHETK